MATSGAFPSRYCVTSSISEALGDQRRFVNTGYGVTYEVSSLPW